MIRCPALSDADLQAAFEGKSSLQLLSASPAETRALAARLAQLMSSTNPKGQVILLLGDLGSGKTTFVQGFCQALGVKEKITSPTFTLMHVYHGEAFDLYHFDFEGEGISLIEWPELALPLLPSGALRLKFSMVDFVNQPEARVIELARLDQAANDCAASP
jgi:tRNA threonylcarbamoyladenosine biosynthesis protein TsaE